MEQLILSAKKIASQFSKELGFVNSTFLKEQLRKKELIVIENIGFVNFHHRKDNQTTIYEIAVSKEYQRQGYGRLLFFKVLCSAIENNKNFIQLKCTFDNVNAHKFYELIGFKKVGEEQGKKRMLFIYRYDITLPFLFYCGSGGNQYDKIAQSLGWTLGINSKIQNKNNCLSISFVDNDWKNYDHKKHLKAVKKHKPLLATVKDFESINESQLIIKWAKELAEYCGRVLIIPKLPKSHIYTYLWQKKQGLWNFPHWSAYSIPTNYGGVEYDKRFFDNQFIHLLGGSPTQQSRFYDLFDNHTNCKVVSLDGNYSMKIAKFGKSVWQGNDSGEKVVKGCYESFKESLTRQYKYWRKTWEFNECPLFMNQ